MDRAGLRDGNRLVSGGRDVPFDVLLRGLRNRDDASGATSGGRDEALQYEKVARPEPLGPDKERYIVNRGNADPARERAQVVLSVEDRSSGSPSRYFF